MKRTECRKEGGEPRENKTALETVREANAAFFWKTDRHDVYLLGCHCEKKIKGNCNRGR